LEVKGSGVKRERRADLKWPNYKLVKPCRPRTGTYPTDVY